MVQGKWRESTPNPHVNSVSGRPGSSLIYLFKWQFPWEPPMLAMSSN